MALSEQGLIQQATGEFRQRLIHSQVPLHPHHFSEFCEESKIQRVAKAERTVVVEEFMKKVLTLSSLDLTKIGDLCKELCLQLQAVIDECIAKNKEHKIKAEAFLNSQIDYLCDVLRQSLEAKLILLPEMDMVTLKKHAEHGKAATTAHFEIWKHGNVEFYEMQKRKLEENLNMLEQGICEKQKRRLSEMSTPEVVKVSIPVQVELEEDVPVVQIARNIFENEDDSSELEFESTSSSPATISLVTDDDESAIPAKRQKLTPQWNPLIFRLTADHIAMGTHVGDVFVKQFRSKYGEPPVVGLQENGSLLCGSAAYICREHWSLEEFLGESSPGKKITFRTPGGQEVSQELNVEFLLGFILKSMKTYAESQLKKNFNSVVISIPVWFPSLHRTQIRAAAEISGFATVHLVNHESVAVYAHVIKGHRNRTQPLEDEEEEEDIKSDVLVLSESFGVVSAVLYECHWSSSSNLNNVIMIRDQYSTIGRNEDPSMRRANVKDLCVLVNLFRGNGNGNVPDKVIFLTESLEWMRTFENVARDQKYNFDDDDISGVSVSVLPSEMFGASIFSEKTVEEMHASVHEYLPRRLEPSLELEGSRKFTKLNQHRRFLPKEIEIELAMEYFHNKKERMMAKISQENLSRGGNVPSGVLVFKGKGDPKILASYSLSLLFEMNVEGVLTGETVRLNTFGKWGLLSSEDFESSFEWLVPSSTRGEIEAIKGLVNSIVTTTSTSRGNKPANEKRK